MFKLIQRLFGHTRQVAKRPVQAARATQHNTAAQTAEEFRRAREKFLHARINQLVKNT